MDDVGDEREPAADPGMARERRRGHEQRCRKEQRRRGHAAERKRGDEEPQQSLCEPDPSKPRLEDRPNALPARRLAEAEPARGRTLEDDPEQRSHTERDARGREHPPEQRLRSLQDRRERDRSPDDEKERDEVEEAHEREEHAHVPRRPVSEHLGGDPGRVRPRRLDVEDERARHGVRVGRRRAPRHRVRAAGQTTVQRRGDRPLVRPLDVAAIDASRLRVVDAHAAERALDRLVEAQDDLPRRLLEDSVVRRFGCRQRRVSAGRGCHRERRSECGDREEPATDACAPCGSVHGSFSSLALRGQRASGGPRSP